MKIATGSRGRLSGFAGSAAVWLVVSALAAVPGYTHEKLKVGDMPPPRLTRSVRLPDYGGKIVIISFWASWCAPCRKEMSMLARLQQAATRDKVVIFAVNWRQDTETFWKIQRALRNVDLTLLSDPNGYIGNEYDVDAIPHMVILGRDGRIAAIHVGYGEAEIPDLIRQINSLWQQAPSSSSK